jgi:hypothetical protein
LISGYPFSEVASSYNFESPDAYISRSNREKQLKAQGNQDYRIRLGTKCMEIPLAKFSGAITSFLITSWS